MTERQPQLQTSCILKSRYGGEGLRISVMSRHTLNDGKTNDERITKGVNYDYWWPNIAPPQKLVGDYYKRDMPWEKFEDRYIDFLQNVAQRYELDNLIYVASKIPVTILCIEETPVCCHRRLLAEECKRINPNIDLTLH